LAANSAPGYQQLRRCGGACTGETIRSNKHYASISHRWGSDDFLKLTAHNPGEFKKGTSLESLPRTFRDCILVAKKLDIGYIWVDLLCII